MNRILVVLGVLFLLAAAGTYLYAVSTPPSGFFGGSPTTTYPYQVYAFPLLVGGVVLVAVGLVRH